MPAPKKSGDSIDVVNLRSESVTFAIVGESPFVFHRMSEKARQELLLPRGRKNAHDRASSLKHNPPQEFVDSAYRFRDLDEAPTRCFMPAAAFKRALADAALDMPGAAKSQIGRLTWVQGLNNRDVPIYGIPQLYMAVVRSSDMNRTPDIRTRARLDEWAAIFTVNYQVPLLNKTTVAALMAAAGFYIGIGDGRQQKGALDFGRFRLCGMDDPDLQRIMATGGRAAQDQAFIDQVPADAETEELLSWFHDEVKKRNGAEATPMSAVAAADNATRKRGRPRANGAAGHA